MHARGTLRTPEREAGSEHSALTEQAAQYEGGYGDCEQSKAHRKGGRRQIAKREVPVDRGTDVDGESAIREA